MRQNSNMLLCIQFSFNIPYMFYAYLQKIHIICGILIVMYVHLWYNYKGILYGWETCSIPMIFRFSGWNGGLYMTREKQIMFGRRSLKRTTAAVCALLLSAAPAQLPAGISLQADAASVFAELYVSPDGDDSSAGTLESPLRTLAMMKTKLQRRTKVQQKLHRNPHQNPR